MNFYTKRNSICSPGASFLKVLQGFGRFPQVPPPSTLASLTRPPARRSLLTQLQPQWALGSCNECASCILSQDPCTDGFVAWKALPATYLQNQPPHFFQVCSGHSLSRPSLATLWKISDTTLLTSHSLSPT